MNAITEIEPTADNESAGVGSGGAVIRRATVDSIVRHRDEALARYALAHEAIAAASAAIGSARAAARQAAPCERTSYNYDSDAAKAALLSGIKVPDRAEFLALAQRLTDTDCWAYIVQMTDLERLMDKKAKDELRQQLLTDPPEITADNIFATLQQLAADSDTIFKRGIAECFSNLDRRFRSHDGWRIGSRIILSYAFNEWGSWNYHRNERDTLIDIERTFSVLDGDGAPAPYAGIVGAIDNARRDGRSGRRQTEIDSTYFRIRIFKNGNCHIWFTRDDLVARVNRLLGEYYGAPIPHERDADPDDGLDNPKTAIAKNYAFFPTPDAVAATVIESAKLWKREDEPAFRVLEPSAGNGSLARAARAAGSIVSCVEAHPERAAELGRSGQYAVVLNCDFLRLRPAALAPSLAATGGAFDRVIMNPPFDRERDIDHVMHALEFLKPDGFLCAVMSAGTEFRETRKAIAFRELMTKMRAQWRDLPAGSFSAVGTNVNTVLLTVYRDGRQFYR